MGEKPGESPYDSVIRGFEAAKENLLRNNASRSASPSVDGSDVEKATYMRVQSSAEGGTLSQQQRRSITVQEPSTSSGGTEGSKFDRALTPAHSHSQSQANLRQHVTPQVERKRVMEQDLSLGLEAEGFPPLVAEQLQSTPREQGTQDVNGKSSQQIDRAQGKGPTANAWLVRPRIGLQRSRAIRNLYLDGVAPEWGSNEQRDQLLQQTPLWLDGHSLQIAPWTPDYNPRQAGVKKTATWVELPQVNPMIEPLCDRMLKALGQPTYRTLSRGQTRYPNVRGCVMMDEGSNRPNKIAIELPWGGVAVQEIRYQDVPNLCFRCRKPGHQTKDCMMATGSRNEAPQSGWRRNTGDTGRPGRPGIIPVGTVLEDTDSIDDGFTEVTRRKPGKTPGVFGGRELSLMAGVILNTGLVEDISKETDALAIVLVPVRLEWPGAEPTNLGEPSDNGSELSKPIEARDTLPRRSRSPIRDRPPRVEVGEGDVISLKVDHGVVNLGEAEKLNFSSYIPP
ncbi:hypothetical protein R1sor_011673 [Riccia sorocarpa]|uniref:CCHC-type domain-containing protein n=1 Tax=Riccia sorocarpa TaxID=122646 RepID=A0ABD3I495_9MARC